MAVHMHVCGLCQSDINGHRKLVYKNVVPADDSSLPYFAITVNGFNLNKFKCKILCQKSFAFFEVLTQKQYLVHLH